MSASMPTLQRCPDCDTPPTVSDRKNVYGLSCGVTIECKNPECPGIRQKVVNRFAYSDIQWNRLLPIAQSASAAYVGLVLNGDTPSERICAAIGIEKSTTTTYRQKR